MGNGYYVCPECEATLDPQEKCQCQGKSGKAPERGKPVKIMHGGRREVRRHGR